MIICIVGDTRDLSCVYLGWAARRRGLAVVELDEAEMGIRWSFSRSHDRPSEVEVDGEAVPSGELVGALARFDPEAPVPADLQLDTAEALSFRLERRTGIDCMLEGLPCHVANRPWAGSGNGSKPHQMRMLEEAGFKVPEWIVTSSAEEARAFCHDVGPAIYKSVSGLRSRVRRADEAFFDRLAAGGSPVLVQAFAPGDDVRVHVVDGICFGTRMVGLGTDYRFDGAASHTSCRIPEDLAALSRAVSASEELMLAGFDFRLDAAGRWWCLEVNPMPSYITYQLATGQPIAEALLDAFAGAYV